MVDFNQGMTLGDALHRCHALDDEGLYWLEEPIAYNDLHGYVRLTRELKTPVQLGENFYGPRELLRAAPIAAALGIEVSTHLYPEVCGHLMRATETAHWLEWQDWANPILAEPFQVTSGVSLTMPSERQSGKSCAASNIAARQRTRR